MIGGEQGKGGEEIDIEGCSTISMRLALVVFFPIGWNG